MKRKLKKIFAVLLSMGMLMNAMSIPAFAEKANAQVEEVQRLGDQAKSLSNLRMDAESYVNRIREGDDSNVVYNEYLEDDTVGG